MFQFRCARAALPPRGTRSSGKKFSMESGNKCQRWQLKSTRESSSSLRGVVAIASAIGAERLVMIQ
jgi:hypothetical protein